MSLTFFSTDPERQRLECFFFVFFFVEMNFLPLILLTLIITLSGVSLFKNMVTYDNNFFKFFLYGSKDVNHIFFENIIVWRFVCVKMIKDSWRGRTLRTWLLVLEGSKAKSSFQQRRKLKRSIEVSGSVEKKVKDISKKCYHIVEGGEPWEHDY